MADYAITFARSARRELEAFDASILRRVIARIDRLAQEPRLPGSRKLQGEQICGVIELETTGLFTACDRQRIVDIVRIRHRREVYR